MELEKIGNIVRSIKSYYPVTDASIVKLAKLFTENELPKHHLLTRAGIKDNSIYFIEKGCTRTYFLLEDREVTHWFSREGDITFSSWSLYHKTAGVDFVELLEDSTIFSMSIDALDELYRTNLDIANWSRCIHQEVLLKMQTLRMDRLTLSSKERYNKFLEDYPGLVNRVKLGHIASFLGMTPQHLSLIRSEG